MLDTLTESNVVAVGENDMKRDVLNRICVQFVPSKEC
jgi:hypothetical protein